MSIVAMASLDRSSSRPGHLRAPRHIGIAATRLSNPATTDAALAGVGLRLKKTATASAIAAAVLRLLDEPGFRIRAEQLGATLRADAASHAAITELEHTAHHGNERPTINS